VNFAFKCGISVISSSKFAAGSPGGGENFPAGAVGERGRADVPVLTGHAKGSSETPASVSVRLKKTRGFFPCKPEVELYV
jgi:hypothetical protein